VKDVKKTALVAGAQGVIGRNLIGHLVCLGDWNIIGLSQCRGEDSGRLRHISVDLLNPEDCRAKMEGLRDITHIFYAAYKQRPTWAELVPPNLAMLQNVVEHIESVAKELQHVSLLQG
jgi:nucleoside-diphosphate-sugar epimerase